MFYSLQVMFLVFPYLAASEEDKYFLDIGKSEKLYECMGGACLNLYYSLHVLHSLGLCSSDVTLKSGTAVAQWDLNNVCFRYWNYKIHLWGNMAHCKIVTSNC